MPQIIDRELLLSIAHGTVPKIAYIRNKKRFQTTLFPNPQPHQDSGYITHQPQIPQTIILESQAHQIFPEVKTHESLSAGTLSLISEIADINIAGRVVKSQTGTYQITLKEEPLTKREFFGP